MSETLADFEKGFKEYQFSFDDEGFLNSCLIPKESAKCPCCNSQLSADITGWYEHGDGFLMPDELDIDCTREGCFEEYENSTFWRMPYVHWFPVEENAKNWIQAVMEKYHELKAGDDE